MEVISGSFEKEEEYQPDTLYSIDCGLQRHLHENGRPELNSFVDPKSSFIQKVLDGQMKKMTVKGQVKPQKQADTIHLTRKPNYGTVVYLASTVGNECSTLSTTTFRNALVCELQTSIQ